MDDIYHRRRIYEYSEEKVVAVVWGTELIQFVAALQDDLKKMMTMKGILGGMNASEQCSQFPPHQTTILPKWMFFQKLFFTSSLLL